MEEKQSEDKEKQFPPVPATCKQVNPSMLAQVLKHAYIVLVLNLFVYLAMHDVMSFIFLTAASVMLFTILLFSAYRNLKLIGQELSKGLVKVVALISFAWAFALTVSYKVAIRPSFPIGNITHVISVIILAVGYQKIDGFLREQTEVVSTESHA